MTYNWKCCSLYPNNFGASALSANLINRSCGLTILVAHFNLYS